MGVTHNAKWIVVGITGLAVLGGTVGAITPALAQGGRAVARRLVPNASWSAIDRKPDFDTRSRPGFYVWRDRDDVYIVANDRNRSRANRYSGEVTIHEGTLSNVSGYETENGDRFQQVSNNRLRFNFTTDNGLDGVKFRVNGGDRIVVDLQAGGRASERVYLGQNKTPGRDPLVIRK